MILNYLEFKGEGNMKIISIGIVILFLIICLCGCNENKVESVIEEPIWVNYLSVREPKQQYDEMNFSEQYIENITHYFDTFLHSSVYTWGNITEVIQLEDYTILRLITDDNIGVIPLTSSGLNMAEGLEDVTNVPDDLLIAELSRITFRMPGNIRMRPNNEVYDRLLEVIKRTGAKGVIVKTLSFCDLWYTEKERLKQSLPVPVLVLDTGYAEGTDAQVQTRIETFLETLK